jgi:hypothetical protein
MRLIFDRKIFEKNKIAHIGYDIIFFSVFFAVYLYNFFELCKLFEAIVVVGRVFFVVLLRRAFCGCFLLKVKNNRRRKCLRI